MRSSNTGAPGGVKVSNKRTPPRYLMYRTSASLEPPFHFKALSFKIIRPRRIAIICPRHILSFGNSPCFSSLRLPLKACACSSLLASFQQIVTVRMTCSIISYSRRRLYPGQETPRASYHSLSHIGSRITDSSVCAFPTLDSSLVAQLRLSLGPSS